MIKSLIVLFCVFISMLIMVSVHYVTFPKKEYSDTLQNTTALTGYYALSLSQGYDESQYNTTYPEMLPVNRMDFVYER